MFRPTEDTDDWFNFLVLHQNRFRSKPFIISGNHRVHCKVLYNSKSRVAHSVKNYLPTHYLNNVAEFLDLCLWGHEHECKIDPTRTGDDNFHIIQPGSSVATSLCEGEAVEKYLKGINSGMLVFWRLGGLVILKCEKCG